MSTQVPAGVRFAYAAFNIGVHRAREDYRLHPFRACKRKDCFGLRDDAARYCAECLAALAFDRERMRRKRAAR